MELSHAKKYPTHTTKLGAKKQCQRSVNIKIKTGKECEIQYRVYHGSKGRKG